MELNNMQRELDKLLQQLISEETDVNNTKDRLTEIYTTDGFRHSYAAIAGIIFNIKYDEIDMLLEQLKNACDMLRKDGDTAVANQVFRLIEYIKLEVVRLQYMSKFDEQETIISNNLDNLNDEIARIDLFVSNLKSEKNKLKVEIDRGMQIIDRRLENSSAMYITLIGIFSGIVMTFFGGLSFTTRVMESMQSVSIYRLVFVILLVGFVLFNSIFLLLYFVSRMAGKDIRSDCRRNSDELAADIDEVNLFCILRQNARSYPVPFFMNGAMIVFIWIDIIVWTFANSWYFAGGALSAVTIAAAAVFYSRLKRKKDEN